MSEKVFTLIVALVIVLAVCAPLQPQMEEIEGGIDETQLTFMISGDPTDSAAYQSLIDAFVAERPEITINLINIPSSGDFGKRLTADFAAGAPPDVFLMNYRRLGPYVSRGAVEMLTTHLADSSQIDAANYYPQALDGFTWQGDLACMPQNMSSPVIYYNKAIFDAAGLPYPHDDWTWDDFVATAKTLTQNFDRDGLIDIYGLGVEPSLVRAAPFIWMNGADIVDDPAAPTRLTLDSPASKEALAWFIALQTIHKVVPDAVAEESESSESRFLNGRLAMLMESRRASPEFRAIQAFDWDVAALPVGKERASILHSDAYCISAASKHKDAAWAFIEFANTDQGQSILAQTGRTVPSLRALAQSPVFIDPNARPANSQVFLEAIPSIRHLPLMTTWNDIEGVVDHELRSAYFGLITLDEAIETANRRSAEFFE
jgi:multiple sugar transport system substrate-binding protein